MQALWTRHTNPTETLRLKSQTTGETIGARRKKEAKEDYQKQVLRQRKGTDEKARWVYKQKRYHYGYKKHCLTNVQGIVQKVITTAANRSDTKEFIPLLEEANVPQGTVVLADKGYACGEIRLYPQTHHLQDGIMHKAQRNRALTEEEKQRNKAISPIRSTIERTFWLYSPVVSWRTISIPRAS